MSKREKVDRKIKSRKRKLILIIFVFLVTIFCVVVTKTSILNIKKIAVIGNKEITKDKIIVSSGIIIGENILKVDLKNAKENLLLHPYIKNIDIKRKLPDKVIIDVKEREEIAVINHMNSYTYIGYDGLVLNILPEKKDNDTPEIVGLDIKEPSIGSKIQYDVKGKGKYITDFFQAYSQSKLKEQTSLIKFDKKLNATIVLKSDVEVAFGPLDNVKYKLNFLLRALEDLDSKGTKAKTIYLNKGEDIIVELINS